MKNKPRTLSWTQNTLFLLFMNTNNIIPLWDW